MKTLTDPSQTTAIAKVNGRSPRLLLVAYNFPPVGGAGVQRPVKWVKNLRRFGWDVTVLTTENPSVPARDESLLADIPDDVLVARARTWEPDYQTKLGLVKQPTGKPSLFTRIKSALKGLIKQGVKLALQPDPQVLWVPDAIRVGQRILRELDHDVILVTAPAYSSFFVGTWLKRQFGIPLVLDFRDEWDMSGRYLENAHRDLFSQVVQAWMQNHILKRADAVVATTLASTANLGTKLAALGKSTTQTATVYNGFDADEFEHTVTPAEQTAPSNSRSTFRLLYTGTLWNLTTIEPLVDSILRLNQNHPGLVSKLELVCVGRKTHEQTAILEQLKSTDCRMTLIDYSAHAKVLEWLRSADAVCLLLSDVPGAERVVPAKLFEYMAIRKDMLAIVPAGETAAIVNQFFPNGSIEPRNVDGIVNWLKARLSDNFASTTPPDNIHDINEYSRERQTEKLVKLLDSLVHEKDNTRRPIP